MHELANSHNHDSCNAPLSIGEWRHLAKLHNIWHLLVMSNFATSNETKTFLNSDQWPANHPQLSRTNQWHEWPANHPQLSRTNDTNGLPITHNCLSNPDDTQTNTQNEMKTTSLTQQLGQLVYSKWRPGKDSTISADMATPLSQCAIIQVHDFRHHTLM